MTTTDNLKSSGHVSWRGLAFACLGAIVGAGYSYGISVLTASGPVTSWVLGIIGSGLLGLIGYRFSDSPDYSTIQKIALILLVPAVLVASSIGVLAALVLFAVLSPIFVIQNIVRQTQVSISDAGCWPVRNVARSAAIAGIWPRGR